MGAGADDRSQRLSAGPSTGADGTYNYTPISGQRDSLGFIRVDDPNVPNTGFGKNPFIDIGAYEYVNLHPPEVTAVTATLPGQTTPVNFYTVGGKSGANQTPQTINITFTSPIDPNSINASTVMLEALGSHRQQHARHPASTWPASCPTTARPTRWSSTWAAAG